ncbi:DUF3592 domain-containing protein [Lentisphaerota bacterium WC36G]|nr:DUF3592 domain-containing protein [Lentisphaerae bacterium WC36]
MNYFNFGYRGNNKFTSIVSAIFTIIIGSFFIRGAFSPLENLSEGQNPIFYRIAIFFIGVMATLIGCGIIAHTWFANSIKQNDFLRNLKRKFFNHTLIIFLIFILFGIVGIGFSCQLIFNTTEASFNSTKIIIPIIFILISISGILFTWKNRRVLRTGAPVIIGMKRSSDQQILLWLYGIFLTSGLLFGIFTVIIPLFNVIRAQSWQATSCIIESSNIKINYSGKHNSYKVHIKYNYIYKNKKYTSISYSFYDDGDNILEPKKKIIAKYPANSTQICYVNPTNPSDVVLCRSIRYELPFFGGILFFIVFSTTGGIGLYKTLKKY